MDRTYTVTSALDSFLKMHLPHSSIGAIDDIVLNYLVGILEDLGNEDGFDVEDFAEMMEAYIPGFGDISSATICEWIFQLSRDVLSSACTKETPPTPQSSAKQSRSPKEPSPLLDDIELPYSLPSESSNRRQENCRCDARKGKRADSRFQKSNSSVPSPRNVDDKIEMLAEMFPDFCKVEVKRCLSDSSGDIEQAVQVMLYLEDQKTGNGSFETSNKLEAASAVSESNIQLLLEMFPGSSELQARQCLSIAKGDLDQALQVLLNLQESGKIEEQGSMASLPVQRSSARNEIHVKESLLEKYGYIDTDDDKKNHKPMEPKKEKKKMVRYINSQTVTTKGEKFVETKKPEPEEMKKTYTNLKPARRYHFH